jgi:cytochrome c
MRQHAIFATLAAAAVKSALVAAPLAAAIWTAPALAADARAAQGVLRRSRCGTCHANTVAKDGPSWAEIAAKYKGDEDAEEKLIYHLESEPMVTTDTGEWQHMAPTVRNFDEIHNLVKWILER